MRLPVHRSLLAAALGAVPGCTVRIPPPVAPARTPATLEAAGPAGLVQRVVFSPAPVARGDTLEIRSTLLNRGTAPVTVTAQVCGLGITAPDGVLAADNGIRCVTFSVPLTLAPGESTIGTDRRAVTGAAGRYPVRVQQALDPAFEATGEIEVR
jgi:hypothetical protein